MLFNDFHSRAFSFAFAFAMALCVSPVVADSTSARCDIYPAGSDHADAMLACTFSQRQGYVTIDREDGVTHEFSPDESNVGVFTDQRGRTVYRQSGLGDQGLIFRMPDESLYVYWDASALQSPGPTDVANEDADSNPTAPFTTQDYEATTLLLCRTAEAAEFSLCPAGIQRMENAQASIVVVRPDEAQFTINFMSDYVNATHRAVEAQRVADTWTLTFENGDVWEVPVAAIEGG